LKPQDFLPIWRPSGVSPDRQLERSAGSQRLIRDSFGICRPTSRRSGGSVPRSSGTSTSIAAPPAEVAAVHPAVEHTAEAIRAQSRQVAGRNGHDQTEIDALAALRPGVLRETVIATMRPYYDPTLRRQVVKSPQLGPRVADAIRAVANTVAEITTRFQ
jgi:hypothetical protein